MWKSTLPLLLAALAACSAQHDPRLKPLANATLESGVGLGDLHLGETTLGEFFERFGGGRTDMIASDDIGLELVFEHGQIAFLFLLERTPQAGEVDALRGATRDLASYFASYPAGRDLRLSSITVAAGKSRDASFFQGRSSEGVRLLDPIANAMVELGVPNEGMGPMMAGASPDLPTTKMLYPERGIAFFYELEEANRIDANLIQRMTVFAPSDS